MYPSEDVHLTQNSVPYLSDEFFSPSHLYDAIFSPSHLCDAIFNLSCFSIAVFSLDCNPYSNRQPHDKCSCSSLFSSASIREYDHPVLGR